MKVVSWFSAGVSSAIATKILIDEIDEIIYTHINDQHPDSMRFVKECEEWFGKPITILQSAYKNVENVCLTRKYVNGVHGAPCTVNLKKKVRIEWEYNQPLETKLCYIWGLDCTEKERAERLVLAMPNQEHRFPLIEQSISKEYAHEKLNASGIKRPVMYELGYNNNNCIGCVKGGMGYWNKIRVDFPEVFNDRAKMERKIGASALKDCFLDELDINAGNMSAEIMDDCGIFCELEKL